MSNRGFTLLELMAAAFVLMVGIAAIGGLLARFLNQDLFLTPKMQAAHLSQEAIEVVKNIRDTNWIEEVDSWDVGIFCCEESIDKSCETPECECACEVDYESEDLGALDVYAGRTLKVNTATGLFNYDSGDETNFIRRVRIRMQSEEMIEVCVDTRWGGGDNETVNVCSNIYDWYVPIQ